MHVNLFQRGYICVEIKEKSALTVAHQSSVSRHHLSVQLELVSKASLWCLTDTKVQL